MAEQSPLPLGIKIVGPGSWAALALVAGVFVKLVYCIEVGNRAILAKLAQRLGRDVGTGMTNLHACQLGRRCIGESCDDPARPSFRQIDNSRNHLGEMANYPSPIAVLTDTLKKKCVRFDELSLKNGQVKYLKQNIVVLRGAADEVVHGASQRNPSGIT